MSINAPSDGTFSADTGLIAPDAFPGETVSLTPSRFERVATTPPPKTTYKVAIVGKAPSSLGLAPYLDSEWSIWGLSDLCLRCMPRGLKPTDRWFELHDFTAGKQRWPKEFVDWLVKNHDKCPFYTGHRLRIDKRSIPDLTLEQCRAMDAETKPPAELPHATPFPIYEFLKRFSCGRDLYFNNSVSYMIGMAIMEGATHINIYGVDMAQSDPATGQNGEFEHQRPSCEYMLGWARGAGVQVSVPGESDLLKCRNLYAFETHGCEDEDLQKYKARRKELQSYINQNTNVLNDLQTQIVARKGALDQLDYWWRRSR